MKLKCTKHFKRVMVLPTTTVVHRDNGMVCDTTSVAIGRFEGSSISIIIREYSNGWCGYCFSTDCIGDCWQSKEREYER